MSYEESRTKPFEDIARADLLLNRRGPEGAVTPSGDDVALAHALCALASAKMMGRGRA